MTPDLDKIVEHVLEKCRHCGYNLEDEKVITHACRQEIDVPPEPPVVIEHQAQQKLCPNFAWISTAQFPAHITQPIQYGLHLKARSIYLSQYQFVPCERLAEYFQDCHQLSISEGTLVNFNDKGATVFTPAVIYYKNQIINSPVRNFDEFSMKINGKNHWLHVASILQYTCYEIHAKRGKEAMDDIGILPNYNGIAVHDHWKAYLRYLCDHALCNSHHLRELIFAVERYHQQRAQNLIDCLLKIRDAIAVAKAENRTILSVNELTKYSRKYSRILREGCSELPILPATNSPPRKNAKQHKIKNLWDRLRKYKKETLFFMYDFRVPFTNNLPERDIRMCKTKAKISGSFRSVKGAKIFANCRSYISTIKKHKANVLHEIMNALKGKPFRLN